MDARAFHGLLKPVQECNPDTPRPLCNLIHRCLSFKAQQRPEHASEVQTELEQLAKRLVHSPEDRLGAMEW